MAGAGAVGAGGSGAGSRGSGAGNSSGRGGGSGAGGSGVRAGGSGAGAGGSGGAGASRSGRPGSLTSIAASAGVSVSTVSKVLNGRTDVAPETRERLGRILRQHGYQGAAKAGIGVVGLVVRGPR